MKTELDLRLLHLEKRTDMFNQLRIGLETQVEETIDTNGFPKTDENAIFIKYQLATGHKVLFEYTNYLSKKIPNFSIFTEKITNDMFTNAVGLLGIMEIYQHTLEVQEVEFLSLEDYTDSKPDSLLPLRQAIDIESFLGSLDDIVISSQELRLEFVNITQSVIDAINTYYKIADFDYSFKAKHFVIMTNQILAKYGAYKERIDWLGLGTLEEEKHIDTVLKNTLERYNYIELLDTLTKDNVIVKKKD